MNKKDRQRIARIMEVTKMPPPPRFGNIEAEREYLAELKTIVRSLRDLLMYAAAANSDDFSADEFEAEIEELENRRREFESRY